MSFLEKMGFSLFQVAPACVGARKRRSQILAAASGASGQEGGVRFLSLTFEELSAMVLTSGLKCTGTSPTRYSHFPSPPSFVFPLLFLTEDARDRERSCQLPISLCFSL